MILSTSVKVTIKHKKRNARMSLLDYTEFLNEGMKNMSIPDVIFTAAADAKKRPNLIVLSKTCLSKQHLQARKS